MSTELLAPAGSLAGLMASINAGADAVYIGGKSFGARAYADNPEEEALIRGLDFAHLRGRRVYLTVNTLLKETEMEALADYLAPYVAEGLDAVLVQDFGVLSFLRGAFPMLPLHASTQMTVTGPKGASLLKAFGVTRVVPARELSLPELIEIKAESGLEVETFVHGALCYSYSGQCLMSSLIGGRSGNRGRCAQPCRLLNLLNDREHFDGRSSILDRRDARHYLSPKDLCAIGLLPELAAAGIDSLKIEGRMKRPEYAAGVVSIYRAALDRALEGGSGKGGDFFVTKKERQALYDLYNRSGFTDGYFHRKNGPEMMAPVKHELSAEETNARHALYEQMKARYMDKNEPVGVKAALRLVSGEPLTAELCAGQRGAFGPVRVTCTGPVAERAKKSPLGEARIRESFMKTGGTDFAIEALTVDTDGFSFVPVSVLNEFRRQALESLREACLKAVRRTFEKPAQYLGGRPVPLREEQPVSGKLAVSALVADREQLRAALEAEAVDLIYVEAALLCRAPDPVAEAQAFILQCTMAGKRAAIAMPRVDRTRAKDPAVRGRRKEDGEHAGKAAELKAAAPELIRSGLSLFLVRTLETAADLAARGLAAYLRADAGLYTFNREAQRFLRSLGIFLDTAPLELNRRELRQRENRDSEIVVYGALPLMVSAQCLKKNTDACTRRNEQLVLTDRTGAKFKVRCECAFCYTVHYNYLPLSLLEDGRELLEMGFSGIRLSFTGESYEACRRILAFSAHTARGEEPETGLTSTRGHFLRGVE